MTDTPTPVADARAALADLLSVAHRSNDVAEAKFQKGMLALSALTPEVVRMADAAPQREAERREMVAATDMARDVMRDAQAVLQMADRSLAWREERDRVVERLRTYADHHGAILARAEKEAGA